jgi:hypothetical protein
MQRGDLLSLRGKNRILFGVLSGLWRNPKDECVLQLLSQKQAYRLTPRRIRTTPENNDESVRRGSLRVSCEIQRLISCIFSRIDFIQSCAGKLKSFSRSQIHSLNPCCVYYLVVLTKCSLNNLLRNSIFI